MKKPTSYAYTFNANAKTVNLAAIPNFKIENLFAILNVTSNVLMYAAGQAGYGYTSVSSGVVTLQFDTTFYNNSDKLMIIYEEDDVLIKNTLPLQDDYYTPIRPLPQKKFRTTFAKTLSNAVDTAYFSLLVTGSGQTVNQSGGNLVLTSGTTTNSETILRSVSSFSDAMILKWSAILSQRIVNNNFFVELVDVIGDGLAMTVNSATSVTITIPSNPFNSTNVGQFVYIGNVTGVSGAIPGRYAIASVSGNNVNFTVASWPASGSGTASLFGWNYHQVLYSGATVTNAFYDAQRRGWNSGQTTATINTTASPGHVGIVTSEDGIASFLDQLAASSGSLQTTMRASRVQNIPAQETPLYIQIRSLNGSTAPASTTTFTVGFVSLENFASQNVTINSVKPQPFNAALPMALVNTPTVTANIGTGSLAAGTNAIGDVGVQYRASATGAATIKHVVAAATTNATSVKASAGRLLGWHFQNTSAAIKYVKLHNIATAPTAGSGVVMTIGIPANGSVFQNLPGGIGFATGIGYTIVGGAADTDATAVALNDVVGDLFYA